MENRPRTTFRNEENRRLTQPKFKNIKMEENELQSKYDIYKNGSPNVYEQDIEALKAYHIKSDVKTLQLPAIDYILQEVKNIPPNTGTNQRDYNIHPSMIQKYSNKFRNLISDQQEIRDFMGWLNKKQKQISNKNCNQADKFYLNQSLIASGFNQILTQIAQVSKPRSEIIRMLWNKQNGEIEQIINLLHKQNTDSERKNLQTIKYLHLGYQQQIIQLKSDNYCTQKKLQQANILNESCLNTLRVMKKQIKKYEKIIKQLNQSNITLKQQSLMLLKQNSALLMKQKGLSSDQARILSYRGLQIVNLRNKLRENKSIKKVFKDVKNKAQTIVQNSEQHDLEQKKQKLIGLIKKRIKQYPQQKTFILKGQFSDDEEEHVNADSQVEELFKITQIKSYLRQRNPNQIVSVFHQKQTNTDICFLDSLTQKNESGQSIGIQTQEQNQNLRKSTDNSLISKQGEQLQGRKKLKDKKIYQRHSLMMIQMNKMMEFKKIDTASKIRKLSRFSSINLQMGSAMNNSCKNSRFQSQCGSQSSISEVSESQVAQLDVLNFSDNKPKEHNQANNRQKNVLKMHHESLLTQKSSDFQNMIKKISNELNRNSIALNQINSIHQDNLEKQGLSRHVIRLQDVYDKIAEFRQVIKKYLSNREPSKQITTNPQKCLKKLLTDTYKNLYISHKTDFLSEIIRTAKHCYGNVIYENKLLHLISMIVEHKDKSLLSAICLLLNVEQNTQYFDEANYSDICQIYFKIYFYLSIKNPTENQFNIWGNYTNINKLNSPGFLQILSSYFNESKCMYLQYKIRQFIGIGTNQPIDGNYYVQLNPLMMYLLQVYLLEKKNYYESYRLLIDFLSQGQLLGLDTFVFLLDLLCLKENEQRQLIQTYFNSAQNLSHPGYCHKGVFYKICVKYQLPLFEFIKLLKLEQFKKLGEHIQNEYMDIDDSNKWSKMSQALQRRLRSRNKMTLGLQKILQQLNSHIKEFSHLQNVPFYFLYRVAIYTAFS